MIPNVQIFTTPEIMAVALAEEFYRHVNEQLICRNKLCIALSVLG